MEMTEENEKKCIMIFTYLYCIDDILTDITPDLKNLMKYQSNKALKATNKLIKMLDEGLGIKNAINIGDMAEEVNKITYNLIEIK